MMWLETDVSSLFANTRTLWRHNEREIYIMHEVKLTLIFNPFNKLCSSAYVLLSREYQIRCPYPQRKQALSKHVRRFAKVN